MLRADLEAERELARRSELGQGRKDSSKRIVMITLCDIRADRRVFTIVRRYQSSYECT